MDFKKENFNSIFKITLDSMLMFEDENVDESQKIIFYKILVKKFHYFIYLILLKEAIVKNKYTDESLKIINGVFEKVKDGKFEFRFNRELVEISLETVSNLIILNNEELLAKMSNIASDNVLVFDDFIKFFIEKNFEEEQKDFSKVIISWSKLVLSHALSKVHVDTLKVCFKSVEFRKIFHLSQTSRPYGAYTGIGESVQKQSISSNAGWGERVDWLIDAFSKRVSTLASPTASIHDSSILDIRVDKNNTNFVADLVPHNVIIYGPPGTGKTRGALIMAEKLLNFEKIPSSSSEIQVLSSRINKSITSNLNWYSVQFHPSFSYEDFFEGLRPVQINTNGKIDLSYEVIPGIFKIVSQLARASLEPGIFGIEIKAIFEKGSIKNWVNSNDGIAEFYRFKNREGYFEFENEKIFITGTNSEELKILESEKLNIESLSVKWYSSDKKPAPFILFIDELNRGNPARIFGEALSLIEVSKRYGSEEATFLNLPYSHEKFTVPVNLNIIGAMNSSDKSLAHIDQAFRRRFKFTYFSPNFNFLIEDDYLLNILDSKIDKNIAKSLIEYFLLLNNSLLDSDVSVDNHVGHSFAIDILKKMHEIILKKSSSNQSELVHALLIRFWDVELHALLRDLLGESKINDFIENHYNRLFQNKEKFVFLKIDEEFKEAFSKYLNNSDSENASNVFRAA